MLPRRPRRPKLVIDPLTGEASATLKTYERSWKVRPVWCVFKARPSLKPSAAVMFLLKRFTNGRDSAIAVRVAGSIGVNADEGVLTLVHSGSPPTELLVIAHPVALLIVALRVGLVGVSVRWIVISRNVVAKADHTHLAGHVLGNGERVIWGLRLGSGLRGDKVSAGGVDLL
eukprot:185389-Amorphochlora_amoeboformis.AAC.1